MTDAQSDPVADIPAIAAEALAALDSGTQIALVTSRIPGFGLADAYRVTAELRRLRIARGERPVGRKIGFTNRNIWPQFGVYAPIWGDMYDTTVHEIGGEGAAFDASALAEPKIEPEIAFGLAHALEPGMDEAALMGCIGWVAHGFEIVQSLFPGWRFEAPDTVAGFGMHGALCLGPRHEIAAGERATWQAALADFSVTLLCDGGAVDRGHSSDVLDAPLNALRHLVDLLAEDPDNPALAAGEIVTTGTVTQAFDIAPGEYWQTRIEGLPIGGVSLRIG
jgi:2-oxo-3-hexenedioate decarboxylase